MELGGRSISAPSQARRRHTTVVSRYVANHLVRTNAGTHSRHHPSMGTSQPFSPQQSLIGSIGSIGTSQPHARHREPATARRNTTLGVGVNIGRSHSLHSSQHAARTHSRLRHPQPHHPSNRHSRLLSTSHTGGLHPRRDIGRRDFDPQNGFEDEFDFDRSGHRQYPVDDQALGESRVSILARREHMRRNTVHEGVFSRDQHDFNSRRHTHAHADGMWDLLPGDVAPSFAHGTGSSVSLRHGGAGGRSSMTAAPAAAAAAGSNRHERFSFVGGASSHAPAPPSRRSSRPSQQHSNSNFQRELLNHAISSFHKDGYREEDHWSDCKQLLMNMRRLLSQVSACGVHVCFHFFSSLLVVLHLCFAPQ